MMAYIEVDDSVLFCFVLFCLVLLLCNGVRLEWPWSVYRGHVACGFVMQ
jgi:hypothetical protein